MTQLDWTQPARLHDSGVDRGVLYSNGIGVPWNGLIGVSEQENVSQDTNLYFDGVRLAITEQMGDYEATIEAITYPDEFEEHSGFDDSTSGKRFGLSFRTHTEDSYDIHLLYNALVKPPSRTWETLTNTMSPSTFSWNVQASSIYIPGSRPAAHLIIRSDAPSDIRGLVEDWLYGTETSDPRLPDPVELVDLFEAVTLLRISYNEDGTWTAEGPDHMVQLNEDGSFELSAPSVQFLNEHTFVVDSY